MSGSVKTYLEKVTESRASGKVADAKLVDSLASAFVALVKKLEPELIKLTRLQEMVE